MRNLYIETDLSRIIGNQRAVVDLRRRGPHEWVYVGTFPGDSNTEEPFFLGGDLIHGSPEFKNSWVNAGGDYSPLAFRFDTHWVLEFKGHITGGATGTVAFTLPTSHWPEFDVSHPTDVGAIDAFVIGRIQISSTTGDVTITFPAS